MAYQVFENKKLRDVPNKRAAWSDRTAHLMAQMSKLAYRKFWYWPALIKSWRSPLRDHSIDVYSQKLEDWATKRLNP